MSNGSKLILASIVAVGVFGALLGVLYTPESHSYLEMAVKTLGILDWKHTTKWCSGQETDAPVLRIPVVCFDYAAPIWGTPAYMNEEGWIHRPMYFLYTNREDDGRLTWFIIAGRNFEDTSLRVAASGEKWKAASPITKGQFFALRQRGVREAQSPVWHSSYGDRLVLHKDGAYIYVWSNEAGVSYLIADKLIDVTGVTGTAVYQEPQAMKSFAECEADPTYLGNAGLVYCKNYNVIVEAPGWQLSDQSK